MSKRKKTTVRVLKLLQTNKWLVAELLALTVAAVVFDIAAPLIFKWLIDNFMIFFKDGRSMPRGIIYAAVVGMLITTLAAKLCKTIYNYLLFREVTKKEDDLRFRVNKKYLYLDDLYHYASSSGQMIGRIERGASGIYAILYDVVGQYLIPPMILFMGVMALFFYKNPVIALAVFIPLPVYIFSVLKISKKIYEMEKLANDEFEELSKESYDVAANIRIVKKFRREDDEISNLKGIMNKGRGIQYGVLRLEGLMEIIQTIIIAVGGVGVFFLAALFLQRGSISIGDFVSFLYLHRMAYAPMWQLSNVLPRFRRNIAKVERLFAILDEPITVTDRPDAKVLPVHDHSIEFKNVSFGYRESSRPALRNVTVSVGAGQTVALVGRSGSGKTTFINLLCRSFDPDEGSIIIDGLDLRDIRRDSLLDQIAVVPQEVDLLSRSIFENIAYGKNGATAEEVETAAKTALAHDFIMQTENGYDTLVGEKGIRLSGGERQRIGIARAVLRDPRILILDEATSHLDTESERLIAEATEALIRNRTTFIIAHRLSTVIRADVILVFKAGEIEAIGKHEELLETSPTYRKLYELQFREPVDAGENHEKVE